ncbi:hypothetical protein BC567DRAFT_215900 [Phyllosticta citribraziliensis]
MILFKSASRSAPSHRTLPNTIGSDGSIHDVDKTRDKDINAFVHRPARYRPVKNWSIAIPSSSPLPWYEAVWKRQLTPCYLVTMSCAPRPVNPFSTWPSPSDCSRRKEPPSSERQPIVSSEAAEDIMAPCPSKNFRQTPGQMHRKPAMLNFLPRPSSSD